MGTGIGRGENRAMEAAQQAISSPLLDNVSIAGACGVLINVTGGTDLTLAEVTHIGEIVQDAAGEEAETIFGATNDPAMAGEIRVTVIATGFDRADQAALMATPASTGKPAPGVINFPTGKRLTTPPPIPSAPPPKPEPRRAPGSSADVPEMEIPTFIRRQMD
jgi:cell division protein FtsZ